MTATLFCPTRIAFPVEEMLALRLVSAVPATATRTPLTLIAPDVLPAGFLNNPPPAAIVGQGGVLAGARGGGGVPRSGPAAATHGVPEGQPTMFMVLLAD